MILRVLFVSIAAGAMLPAAEEGFAPLFDGQSLKGWTLIGGRGPGYVVEDGSLVCPPEGGGNLFTEKEFSNFILRLEFQLGVDGNNGIGIRAPLSSRTSAEGMEIQIIDIGPRHGAMKLRSEQMHGSVYDVIPARTGYLRKPGEWNEQEVTANGRRITIKLNGVIILDNDLDIVKESEVLKKHPGLLRTTGHIGFLGHGTRVAFRNIRVKTLP